MTPMPTFTATRPPSPIDEDAVRIEILGASPVRSRISWRGDALIVSMNVLVTPEYMAGLVSGYVQLIDGDGDVRRVAASVSRPANGRVTLRATVRLPANRAKTPAHYALRGVANLPGGSTDTIEMGNVAVAGQPRNATRAPSRKSALRS